MRTLGELREKITPYLGCEYVYKLDVGYIVWREGTGNNLEMLFIETKERGKGQGLELYRLMVAQLIAQGKKPYNAVFGFMLGANSSARRFYQKMGCTVLDLGRSIYRGDTTSMMWIIWDDLLKNLEIERKTP